MPNSRLIGRSARNVRLRTRYGLILLAISRTGQRSVKRLRSTVIKAGDVLLVQGEPGSISGFASGFGCVPLAARAISIPDSKKTILSVAVMVFAIGGAAFGLLPAAISFATGVLALMLLRIVPLRKLYEAVDWPVIVLLGALIPVAVAMESTGAADLLAQSLLDYIARGNPRGCTGLDPDRHHDPVRPDEQCGNGGRDGADIDQHCNRAEFKHRHVPDGGCDRRFLCVPHPDRAPEQHADPGSRGFPLWRLLETGLADGNPGGGDRYPDVADRLAAVVTTLASLGRSLFSVSALQTLSHRYRVAQGNPALDAFP